MKAESPERQVQLARARLDALRQNAAQQGAYDPALIEQTLSDLEATLDELHAATEELREQNEEFIETRDALAGEHHRYQELFDFAPSGYLVTDSRGTIQEANHAAAAMLNVERDVLSGEPIMSYVAPRHHRLLHTQLTRLEEEKGSAIEWEMGFRPRGAATFDAAVRVGGVWDHRGQLLGLRWAVLDISPRKRLEEELHHLYEAEKDVSTRLKSLDEMKDAFLQAVSHELRSPVTSVIGFASLLSNKDRDLPNETHEEILRQLYASAKRLEHLLTDLLDLDRISRGIVETTPRRTDVAELARQVVAESGFRFTNEIDVEGDAVVADIDVPMVERIVDNLVGNAVRHATAGTRIWINVIAKDEGIMLEVDDDGSGVPDAYKEDIFLPFTRGEADELVPGTGIGLALVAKFAQLHGGRAWVEDRPGGGASFRVWLPSQGVTKGAAR